jgi:hypothetical protein
MSTDEVAGKRDLARLTYENAGREITQAFSVMNANMALVAGTLAALLAALGAGELFASEGRSNGFPEFSSVSLLVLTLAYPLVVRFFIRSLIAYQNLLRFNSVQKAAWRFLASEISWEAFERHQSLYVHEWKSPKTLSRLIVENLKYGYFWVFAVATLPLAWAFSSADWQCAGIVAAALLLVGLGWEFETMRRSRGRYFRTPDQTQLDNLERLMSPKEALASPGTQGVPEAEQRDE